MLVVSRHPDESIVIDLRAHGLGLVTILLVDIRGGDRARIGVDADQSIPVHRIEIWKRIERDRELGGGCC